MFSYKFILSISKTSKRTRKYNHKPTVCILISITSQIRRSYLKINKPAKILHVASVASVGWWRHASLIIRATAENELHITGLLRVQGVFCFVSKCVGFLCEVKVFGLVVGNLIIGSVSEV